MKEIAKMLIVLTLICAVCGFLLAYVRDVTKEDIEIQLLSNVKGPAVKKVLAGSTNDLIADRKIIKIGDKEELVVFIGKKNNKPWAFAFETFGKGFGGEVGVIVGFAMDKEKLTGVSVTTHKETPGLGAKVKSEDMFVNQFKNKSFKSNFKVDKDGGDIDAISGATISSRAVSNAVLSAIKSHKDIKSKL